ncbi:MAG TPA: Asp-tRNA(Asn)/Glu-tRNA(Gln) amidotransferase GatCAB subunit B, partial [Chloroflexota bacterium]|nr:Asp-tRNA(Asn)/Glu-tRNA(Gln) amidotransferase GatCAB subunit B [Chloroflexota bacterium]
SRMLASGEDAATIVRREGLTQVADAGALATVVEQVIAANPRSVADWKSGRKAAANFLLGQVMKATGGKASPKLVNELVRRALDRG